MIIVILVQKKELFLFLDNRFFFYCIYILVIVYNVVDILVFVYFIFNLLINMFVILVNIFV